MIQNNSDKPSQDDLIQIRLKVIEQLKHIMEYDPNKKEDVNESMNQHNHSKDNREDAEMVIDTNLNNNEEQSQSQQSVFEIVLSPQKNKLLDNQNEDKVGLPNGDSKGTERISIRPTRSSANKSSNVLSIMKSQKKQGNTNN